MPWAVSYLSDLGWVDTRFLAGRDLIMLNT